MNWFKAAIVTKTFEEETAEKDESSSLLLEDDLSQFFKNLGPDDTVLYQSSKDVENDTVCQHFFYIICKAKVKLTLMSQNLTVFSAGPHTLEISLRARI